LHSPSSFHELLSHHQISTLAQDSQPPVTMP